MFEKNKFFLIFIEKIITMQIVSVQQIRKSFRVHYGIDYSLETIHVMAKRLGFSLRTIGMKRGYTASIYTELQRHWKEFNELDKRIKERKNKNENGFKLINKDYNPDKFIEPQGRVDYEWEKDESIIRRAVTESLRKLLGGNVL